MILCNEIIEIITEWSIAIRNLVKERYLNFINCMHEDSPKKKPHMPSELKKKKKTIKNEIEVSVLQAHTHRL